MSNPRQGGGRPSGREDRGGSAPPPNKPATDDEIKQIIEQGNVETLVTVADRIGKRLAQEERLTTSQIRNVFGTVRQIQMRWPSDPAKDASSAYRDAVLLRPKLAYFAEREKRAKGKASNGMETLQLALEPALKMLKVGDKPDRQRFDRLAEFFEAIVAYHKKYGGRD